MKIQWKKLYICRHCGENIGFLGKWFLFSILHECKAKTKTDI